MPAASIRSLVNGISPIVGASRDDLRPGDVVTLQSVNVHTTYAWTMADKPDGSAAVFSGSALNASPGTFTVDLEGPYLIRLTADLGLPTETTQFVRLRLLTLFGDLKLIAAGEQLNSSIPVPVDQTPTGWAHTLNTDIQTLLDFIATVSTSGRVYYVDANSGTEGYADYSVIQDAIDAAAGSATATTPWVVLVRPGLYTENLTFQPHVHVVGWPGSAPGSSTAGGDARVCVVRGTHVVSTSASTDVVLLSSLLLETVSGGTAATLRKDGAGSLLLYRCAVEQNGISLTQGPAVQVRQGIAVIDNCKILASASLADDRVALTQTGFASSTLSVRASDIQGPTGVVLNELGGSGVLAEFKHTRISTTGGASSRGLISDAAALLLEYCRVAVDGTGAPLAFHPGAGVLATAVIGIIRWSYIAGTISFDTTGVGGATALTVGASEYTGFSFPGGTPGTLTATTNSTSLFYDNTTSGITAENVQDAIDEVYAYAALVRTLDDAYDGGGVPGSGRTIIADTGAVQIVDAPVPSEPVPPDNTDGRLQVVGNVEVGSIGKPEIDLDPNPFGNGPMLSMGRLIQANNAPFGSTAFVLAQSTGTPDFNNYNLRLQSESSDGGSLIGRVILRGGDGLANGAGTPLGGSVYIQAGWTLAGPLDAGNVFLVPGDAPGAGVAGSTVFVRPQDATQATLTAAGVFVGGVTGTIRFATDMGAIEVDILAGDNLATVLGKFNATKQVTATQTLGVITLTTASRGPVAEIHYLNDTVGNTLDTALGVFNGQSQVDGTWPSTITFRVSADHEISIGLEGTTGALIYNADTGKLTVPGVIDPTAIVFELSSAPTTTATEGAFFFSDGTGGLTLGAPYFRGPSDAVPVALSGGGGGGVSGPGSSTDNALVRWDGAGGATIQNSTGWTLSDAGLLSGSSGSLTLPQAAAPTPTAEGAISWDTNDDVLRVGNGASTLTIPTTSTTLSGGDLGGTLATPTVTDLTITGEAQGSVLYFNGTNWVQLAPGTSGHFLKTNGAGANPAWAAGGGGGGNTISVGTYAARPASATTTGDLYKHLDGPYISIWDGAAWDVFLDGYGQITFPSTGLTSGGNTGSLTVTTTRGPTTLALTSGGAAWAYRYMAYPGTPFTYNFHIAPSFLVSAMNAWTGIVVSDGTKITSFGHIRGGLSAQGIDHSDWTTGSAWSASNNTQPEGYLPGSFQWLQIEDDGATIYWRFSETGQDGTWVTAFSRARTTFQTPTQLGFGVFTDNAPAFVTCDHMGPALF